MPAHFQALNRQNRLIQINTPAANQPFKKEPVGLRPATAAPKSMLAANEVISLVAGDKERNEFVIRKRETPVRTILPAFIYILERLDYSPNSHYFVL